MDSIIQEFERYLSEVLGTKVISRPWKRRNSVPFFLKELYSFYEVTLMNCTCIVLIHKTDVEIMPAELRKHIEKLQKKWNVICIYVCRTVASYNRKRLIKYHVPFVIPGKQMYLPDLGLDLREYFRESRSHGNVFCPATQAVVIYLLLNNEVATITPSFLAQQLDYAIMTMSRSLNELKKAGIIEEKRKWRERIVSIPGDRKIMWNKAKPFLCSPKKEKQCVHLKGTIDEKWVVLAGESGLSRYSMLQAPLVPVYAVSYKNWIEKIRPLVREQICNESEFELEIWRYDPTLFAQDGVADPFSLYLSLQDEVSDERIELALDEMMGAISW